MKRILLITALVSILASLGAMAGNKVQVCHMPPGNPDNFHTITVSENALQSHLAHGDLAGSCFANAEDICDDGNACTIDAMDSETETCLADHPPVDCDDGLLCTTDSCDAASGCQYAPIVCDDGLACTLDACNPFDGQCIGTPIDCGPLGVCLPESGQCNYPCDGITCEPIDQCHLAGQCILPGVCLDGTPVADGTACDDGDASTDNDVCTSGVCAGETSGGACPCWEPALLSEVADRRVSFCTKAAPIYADIVGNDGDTNLTEWAQAEVQNLGADAGYCSLWLRPASTPSTQNVTATEAQACIAQIVDECTARGY